MRIQNFPISFFSVVLGLSGFTIAFQKAEEFLDFPLSIGIWLLWLTIVIFGLITFFYILKIIFFRENVEEELEHPVKLNFFPAFSISLLLISVAFLSVNLSVSKWVWLAGSILHIIFTIKVLTFWIQSEKLEVTHNNPAWFIPVVGNIIVPIAGVAAFPREISWFFYSIGILFWIVLFTILINRIIFHKPIQSKLLPTFFILIAPPAVGFISYIKLAGALNDFARVLYNFALFLFLLLIFQLKYIHQARFYLSWWAYSFPMAALTIATTLMFHLTDVEFYRYLAYVLLTIITFIILYLLGRTGFLVAKRQICVEEE
ncbi:MAG: SLAC1 anion channel family protein [Dehalococcoidales bacterium]|nr:SLAC1 anion channel family protein [Dehalococcoidales bacterium]